MVGASSSGYAHIEDRWWICMLGGRGKHVYLVIHFGNTNRVSIAEHWTVTMIHLWWSKLAALLDGIDRYCRTWLEDMAEVVSVKQDRLLLSDRNESREDF